MSAWRAAAALAALAASLAAVPSAVAAPQCMVASGALLSFGTVVALASTPDATSDSGASFWVNCNAEVTSAPLLYSASARTLAGPGGGSLPFSLSLASPGGTPLPAGAPGAPLGIARDGTNQTVVLHGKIRAADFKALPAGLYSTSITLTLEY